MSENLAAFLLSRFREDLAQAQRVERSVEGLTWPPHGLDQVVADLDAKRMIVAAYTSSDNRALYGGCRDDCEWKALEYVLERLAAQYAHHPDYREDWRLPET